MDKIRNYNIKFAGLKNGKHDFIFDIEQKFFQLFNEEQEFENAHLQAEVTIDKHSTFLETKIFIAGTVDLICDISVEQFSYPMKTELEIQVKFGNQFNDDNDEVLILPHNETELNVAKLIYEAVILAIPMKKVSPEVSEESLHLLDKFSPEEKKESGNIDPRWEALNKLKSNN